MAVSSRRNLKRLQEGSSCCLWQHRQVQAHRQSRLTPRYSFRFSRNLKGSRAIRQACSPLSSFSVLAILSHLWTLRMLCDSSGSTFRTATP